MSSHNPRDEERPPCSGHDLLGQLTPKAHKQLCGSPLEHDVSVLRRLVAISRDKQWDVARRTVSLGVPFDNAIAGEEQRMRSPLDLEEPSEPGGEEPEAPDVEAADVEAPEAQKPEAHEAEEPRPVCAEGGGHIEHCREEDRAEHIEQQVVGSEVPAQDPLGPEAPAVADPSSTPAGRYIKRVKFRDLKPNPVNGTVWDESLAEESIADLAENLERHGQRQMTEINENNEILDGERRWRAQLHLDADHEDDVVVVPGVTTTEAIEEYIYDADDSLRSKSLSERIKLYELGKKVLKARHGRAQGQRSSDEDLCWPAKRVRETAAKRAGFGSAETARRAAWVLREASDEVRAAVSAGEMTINAAYETLPKVPDVPANPFLDDDLPVVESESEGGVTLAASQEPDAVETTDDGDDDPGESVTEVCEEETGEEYGADDEEQAPEEDDPVDDEAEEDDKPVDDDAEEDDQDDEPEPDIWEQLTDLGSQLEDVFQTALTDDYTQAASWYEAFAENLAGTLKAAEPEEQDEHVDDDDDDGDFPSVLLG